jgi:DNA-binding NarL/FixJ family response regulator
VADPHPIARAGLRVVLGTAPGVEVVGEAADGHAALRLADELDPDVVVLEVALPGLGGAEVTALLCAARADRKVLVFTACEDGESRRQVRAAGAMGYVPKSSPADELVRAVLAVAGNAIYPDAAVASPQAGHGGCAGAAGVELSEREAEVLRLIALGYSNKEIGVRLRVSIKTVETYKTRAVEKLDLHGRVDIVRYAAARGWFREVETGVGEAVTGGVDSRTGEGLSELCANR